MVSVTVIGLVIGLVRGMGMLQVVCNRDSGFPAIAGIPAFSYFSQRNPALCLSSGREKIAFTERAQLYVLIF